MLQIWSELMLAPALTARDLNESFKLAIQSPQRLPASKKRSRRLTLSNFPTCVKTLPLDAY
jgi:hypothetical protein